MWKCEWYEATEKPLVWENEIGRPVYRCVATGEETHILPIGALRLSIHKHKYMQLGYDGEAVVCTIPYSKEGVINKTTEWSIDARASNCTKPEDKEHRCWCRHGGFGEIVHVDKVGNTCAAGAGSIMVPGFHGFLHNGYLTNC